MNARTWLIVSAALLPMAAHAVPDATSEAVATLKAKLGTAAGLEVDEVRLTDAGVACINYRVNDGQGGKSRDHAVVQGDDVLKGSSDADRFEKAWSEHCLGPRGGTTAEQ